MNNMHEFKFGKLLSTCELQEFLKELQPFSQLGQTAEWQDKQTNAFQTMYYSV